MSEVVGAITSNSGTGRYEVWTFMTVISALCGVPIRAIE